MISDFKLFFLKSNCIREKLNAQNDSRITIIWDNADDKTQGKICKNVKQTTLTGSAVRQTNTQRNSKVKGINISNKPLNVRNRAKKPV